jgi:hypothetical protein
MNVNTIELIGKLPAVLQVLQDNKPKAGIRSTEFYVSLAVGLFSALSPMVPAPYDVIIPVVTGSLYTAGRFILKGLHAAGIAKAIKELPELKNTTEYSNS